MIKIEPKKVLLSTWGSNGGVDAVVNSLIEGLSNHGIRSDTITHNPYNGHVFLTSSEGDTKFYQSFENFLNNMSWEDYAVFNPHSCNFTSEELSKFRNKVPDLPIVHNIHGVNLHVGWTEYNENPNAEQQTYLDSLTDLTSDEAWIKVKEDMGGWDACKQQEFMFREADKLIYLTDFTRGLVGHWYPELKNDSKEVIIPNGSDFHKYSEDSNVALRATEIRSEIGETSKIIMFSGRITEAKGASDLAMAFDRIKEQYRDAKLLLLGEGGPGDEGLSCVYNHIRPEFQQDVVAPGWISDKAELAAYLKAADALVIPSYHENFSVAALEGMFMGTPVIMGDVDGSHEVYVEPQLAYGTDPGDIGRMTQLFDYIFEDPERARQNAAHVQQVVTQKYNLENYVDSMIEIYKDSVSNSILVNHQAETTNLPKIEDLDHWVSIGHQIFYDIGNQDLGVQLLELSLEQRPDDLQTMIILGNCYSCMGLVDKAQEYYEMAKV